MTGILPYIGGKNRLAKTIIELIPTHTTYVEPFFGGGQVFFRKTPSEVEIINDRSRDVFLFFRVCQLHPDELARSIRFHVVSREWFDSLKNTDPSTLTDIQRAARFLILQKQAFASRVVRRNYAIHVIQRPPFDPLTITESIEQTHKRLARVQIENLPYDQLIRRTDRAQTFFYLDPPYFGKQLYQFNFSEREFEQMAELLRGIKGKFLLSINDTPEIRKLFQAFRLQEVQLHYTSQKKAGRRYRELLIRNF
jgi:DNA adenine methylase